MFPRFVTFISALTGSPTLEEEAVSSLNTPYDAFALAVHVWATTKGLALTAVNDEDCPNDDRGLLSVPLNQTRWTKTAPHYYGLKYSTQSPSQHRKATLDLTITKLGQRDVQVSVSGNVVAHTPENDDTSKSNSNDIENCCNGSFGFGGGGGFGGSFEKKKHGYKLEFGGGGGAGFDRNNGNNPSNPVDPIDPPKDPDNPYYPYPGNPPSTTPQPFPGDKNGVSFGGGFGAGFDKHPDGSFGGGAGGGYGGTIGCHENDSQDSKISGGNPQIYYPSNQYFTGNTFNNNQVYKNTYNTNHHHYHHHHHHHHYRQMAKPTQLTSQHAAASSHNKNTKRDCHPPQLISSSSLDLTLSNTTNGCIIDSSGNAEAAKETDKHFSVATQFSLGAAVHTGFFAEQPRESEDICDVYVSLEAISRLWAQLDALILAKLQPLLLEGTNQIQSSSVNQNHDTKESVSEKSSTAPSIISPQPIVASQSSAAAESSPSPAAQGPGTPFSPYGTPPPFAARALRKSLKGGAFDGEGSGQTNSGLDNLTPTEDENGQDASLKKIEGVVGSTGTARRSEVQEITPGVPKPPSIPQQTLREDLPNRGREVPPGFEDEYEILGSLAAGSQGSGASGPIAGYGSRDLYPPGMAPGSNPFDFGGLGSTSGGSGGMNPTYGDIQRMIGGQGGRTRGGLFGLGGNEDDNNDPSQLGRPPGARWDPTGPSFGNRGPFGGPGNDFI
ncbi:uncharacterized protein SAPINGB_P006004 [Magnusiomyces paraingens]|uniref:PI31 proteasome regulator C-terminal domain-containing protein n=1 Tax=Magnusiomyces paraingens TaxID=2606893 RepID=A0A5E8C2R0_9ASCO|nr:uncharacterized protein SAPINGB_P006004 [Saprochaete ingens]VVT58034.1 unnamed protein product [Saprochaete ingens]